MKLSFKSIWPYIGTVIIIVGILKAYIFYKAFNIRITDYLELSEALLLFSADIIPYAVFFFLSSILNFIALNQNDIERIDSFRNRIESENNFLKRTPTYLKHYWYLSLLFIVSLFSFILSFFVVPPNNQKYLIDTIFYLSGFVLSILILLKEFELQIARKFSKKVQPEVSLIILSIAFLLSYSVVSARTDIFFKKNYPGKKTHSFDFGDKRQISTTSDTIYLGKTSNYIFLYSRKEKQSFIIKNDDIKMIKILPE